MYQINIDHEIPNIAGGEPNCRSPMHANLGRHHEITIHSFPSGCRKNGGADRPPARGWDDHDRQGYTLAEVATQAQAIIDKEPGLRVRRCRKCHVPPHLPDWD